MNPLPLRREAYGLSARLFIAALDCADAATAANRYAARQQARIKQADKLIALIEEA